MGRPLVRSENNAAWIDTFCKGGWKMMTYEYGYITLNANNFKMRNATNTAWLSFSCPIPVPVDVKRGKVKANRILDSSGYLWCAGYSFGVYDNNQLRSYTWRKVKTGYLNAPYVNNVKRIEAGGDFYDMYCPTYVFTYDDRVLFSGFGSYGNAGNGSYLAASVEYQYGRYRVQDVTDKWNLALGDIRNIAQFDRAGAIVMTNGAPFVLGFSEYEYNKDLSNLRQLGFSGAKFQGQWKEQNTTYRFTHSWTRPQLFDGTAMQNVNVIRLVRTAQNHTFGLTADGKLLQGALWQASNINEAAIPDPKSETNSLREAFFPFTGGVIKELHQGGVIESADGKLWYYQAKRVDNTDFFYGFDWIDTGININAFGSKVLKVCFNWKVVSGVYKPSLFVMLEDGRLYACGNNVDGWFGIGVATDVPMGQPVLINNNVYDFDVEVGNCILTKWDNTIWGTGLNQYGRLGVGDAVKTRTWRQGIIEND